MEARATFSGASVSRTFVAVILVIVAMCLAAVGGYVAKGLGGSNASAIQRQAVHAAPGTVLRQDNPKSLTGTGSVDLRNGSSRQDDGLLKSIGYEGGATVAQIPERSTGHRELP